MQIKKLLSYQTQMIQAPYIFPDINVFMISGGYGCLREDGEILTPDGKIKIKDLKENDIVYSFNKETQQIEYDTCSAPFTRGVGCFYKITLSNGNSIICSTDHRIYTSKGWRKADELTLSSYPLVLNKNNKLDLEYIINIEFVGSFTRYDIEVYKNHNYISDGFINHNCGKTDCLVDSLLFAVQNLSGKKTKAGHRPLIMLCGSTINFMKKTSLLKLEQTLQNTGTEYKWNKADNIINIGEVDIIVVPCENPDGIYGYDSVCCFWDEMDELPAEVSARAFDRIQQRLRQKIIDFRTPFLCTFCLAGDTKIPTSKGIKTIKDIQKGDYVLTRKGYKKVINKFNNGVKDTYSLNGIYMTLNHRLLTKQGYKDYNKLEIVNTYGGKEWKKLIDLMSVIEIAREDLEKLISQGNNMLSLTAEDTQYRVNHLNSIIVLLQNHLQHYTEIFGNTTIIKKYQEDMLFIILTTILLTMKYLTLCLSANINTMFYTEKQNILKENALIVIENLLQRALVLSDAQSAKKNIQGLDKETTIEYIITHIQKAILCQDTQSNVKFVEEKLQRLLELIQQDVKSVGIKLDLKEKERNQEKKQDNIKNNGQVLFINAKYVEKVFTLTEKTLNIALNNACGKQAIKEKGKKITQNVYDIEVEDCHEYFVLDNNGNLLCSHNSTAQGLSGMYNKYVEMKKQKTSFVLIKARTKDNIYLDRSYVQALYNSMSPSRQKAELEGEFVAIDTYNVFAEYDKARHLLDEDFYPKFLDDPEYKNAKIYIGQDFNKEQIGNNAVAAAVIDNNIVFIKDYNITDMSAAAQIFRTDFPTQPIYWIPDTTGADKISAVRAIFQNPVYNIKIISGKNPPITDRVVACNTLFHLDRMFICPVCEDLERSVLLHKYAKDGKIKKGSESAPDHKTDCMSYIVSFILANNPEFYDIYRITLGRRFGYNNRFIPNQNQDDTSKLKRY